MMRFPRIHACAFLAIVMAVLSFEGEKFTRGVAIYPGNPDEGFYAACDKYGMVFWQNFRLANPVDGPDPSDNDLFLLNAKDFVLH
jgi:hypothetical protein